MSHASTARPSIRFGIMSDGGLRFAEWQARCIRSLMAVPNVTPALIIHNTTPVSSSMSARLKRARPNLLLGQVYRNLLSRPAAMKVADLTPELGGAASISCAAQKRGKFSEYFTDADVATLRSQQLDFILRFGFNILRGEVLDSARFGVWSFHHGDEQKYRGVSEGFWEISRDEHVVGAILQRLTDALDAGVVLRKGHFAVVNHSWTATRDVLHFESARWPAQVCVDIQNGVADYLDAPPSTSTAPLHRRPTNAQTVAFASRVAMNKTRRWLGKAFVQTTWGLGVVDAPAASVLHENPPSIRHLRETSRGYRYLADPFVVRAHPPLVLCEEHDLWTRNRGSIVAFEPKNSQVKPALSFGVHASYPFTLRHDGIVYCIPETWQLNRVELHRATELPGRWTLDRVLIENFPAVDPTVFQHDGRWWLAATSATDGPDHNLFLWFAESLFGPWTPHANNPVKCDVRSSRPAGTPFVVDGVLYRPAQDCSDGYGRRLAINAIELLTPTQFRERVVKVVEPDPAGPFPHGIHTLSTLENLTFVDGRRDFFDPFKLIKKMVIAPIVRRLRHGRDARFTRGGR